MAFNRPEHDAIAANDQSRSSTETASQTFCDEVYSRPPRTERYSEPSAHNERMEQFRATNAALEMVHLGEAVFNKISGGDGTLTADDIRKFSQQESYSYPVTTDTRSAVAHLMYSMKLLDERTPEDKANGLSSMVTYDGLLQRVSKIRPQTDSSK